MGAGGLLALLLYVPTVRGILYQGLKQNIATWILWVLLDVIALVTIIQQHGNYIVLALYCCGGTAVVLSLMKTNTFRWGWFENLITALVVICIIIWIGSGPRWATILSSVAIFIATLPQIKDSWSEPDPKTAAIYFGYFIVNTLYLLGGKEWSVQERFYPAICMLACFIVTIEASNILGQRDDLEKVI